MHILSAVALTTVLAIAPAAAAETPAPQKSYLGTFATSVLAGGSTNELTVPVSAEELQLFPETDAQGITIKWHDWDKKTDATRCRQQPGPAKASERITIR